MIIGLTGKYCAGKNAAAALLEARGIPQIDVDKLGHQALASNIDEIEHVFGREVIIPADVEHGIQRQVDRRALGNIVFSDPAELKKLESISHPWMCAETERQVRHQISEGAQHVIINAAILYGMGLDSICGSVIWIEAPLLTRIRRGLARDGAGLGTVLKRIYAQRQLKPKPSPKSVDIYRVGNGSDTEKLKAGLDRVIENIEQKGRDGR